MERVDQNLKRRAVRRARILEGQMRALTAAIEREVYCIDVLVQSLSIQKSLKSLSQLLLENHLRSHIIKQFATKDGEEKAIQELLKIFYLSQK